MRERLAYVTWNAGMLVALTIVCAPLVWPSVFARARFGGRVQDATGEAALRLNGQGNRAGFLVAPQSVARGSDLAVEVSGPPGAAYVVFLGTAVNPGFLVAPYGTLNLDPAQPLVALLSGVMNAHGEATCGFTLPWFGTTFSLQAGVAGKRVRLTNPETVVTR